MIRPLATAAVIAALTACSPACSSQSQSGPGPSEAQTVPTNPEPRVEVTPPEGAEAAFPKASKDGQKHSEELVEKGRAVLKSKGKAGASEAAGIFGEAITADSRNAIAYWELGWARQIGGDYDAALAAWQKLKQLDPKFPDLDNFSTITTMRRNESAEQAQAATQPNDEPPLATTPTKKKSKKAEGARPIRMNSGEAAKDAAKGTSEPAVPTTTPQ